MWCSTDFCLCKVYARIQRDNTAGGTSTPYACLYPDQAPTHSEHGSHAPPKHAFTTPPPKTGTLNTCTRASKSPTRVDSRGCPTSTQRSDISEQHEALYLGMWESL
jgi:hypothetical protein